MLPRMFPPTGIAKDYSRELVQVVARIRPCFRELELMMRATLRMDSNEGSKIRSASQRARAKMAKAIDQDKIYDLADRFGKTTSTYQRVQLSRVTHAALGADPFIREPKLKDTLEVFAHANVQLIKGIGDKVANDIESAALRAVMTGTTNKDFAAELEDRFGFPAKRAKLIARDQIGSLYGRLNAERQKALGISKFTWRTVNDQRVRPEHDDREGKVYSFDDPPDGELPGEPINCRCYAEPVFEFEDGDS